MTARGKQQYFIVEKLDSVLTMIKLKSPTRDRWCASRCDASKGHTAPNAEGQPERITWISLGGKTRNVLSELGNR